MTSRLTAHDSGLFCFFWLLPTKKQPQLFSYEWSRNIVEITESALAPTDFYRVASEYIAKIACGVVIHSALSVLFSQRNKAWRERLEFIAASGHPNCSWHTHTHLLRMSTFYAYMHRHTWGSTEQNKKKQKHTAATTVSSNGNDSQSNNNSIRWRHTTTKKKQFDACGTLTKANVEKGKRENCNPTVTNKTLVCARLVCVVHTRTKKKRSRQLAASSGKGKTVLRWMVEVYIYSGFGQSATMG